MKWLCNCVNNIFLFITSRVYMQNTWHVCSGCKVSMHFCSWWFRMYSDSHLPHPVTEAGSRSKFFRFAPKLFKSRSTRTFPMWHKKQVTIYQQGNVLTLYMKKNYKSFLWRTLNEELPISGSPSMPAHCSGCEWKWCWSCLFEKCLSPSSATWWHRSGP